MQCNKVLYTCMHSYHVGQLIHIDFNLPLHWMKESEWWRRRRWSPCDSVDRESISIIIVCVYLEVYIYIAHVHVSSSNLGLD